MTFNLRASCIALTGALGAFGSICLAGNLTIRDIAPPETAIVVSVDDFAAARTAWQRTGMYEVWKDDSVQQWFKSAGEDAAKEFNEILEELSIDKEDLEWPTGAFGIAVWMHENQDDEESSRLLGFATEMLMFAEYSGNSEAMHALINKVLERGEEKQTLEVVADEYDGNPFFTVRMLEQDDEADEEDEDEWGEFEDADPMEDLMPEEMYYAKAGDYLLIGTNQESVELAIDRIGGDDMQSAADRREITAALAQIGTSHATAAIVLQPFFAMLQEDPDSAMAVTMLSALGIDQIQAASLGMRFDTDAAMMEQTWGVLVPTKRGLVSLFDAAPEPFVPPAFVGPDITTLTSFKFQFPELVTVANKIISEMPQDEDGGAMAGQMQAFLAMASPVLTNLGPDVHMISSHERPYHGDSAKNLFIVRIIDQQALSNAIAGFAPMMGLIPRDFMGNQIFAPQPGMMGGDMALGLGFNHVFIGPAAVVENAMRQAGQTNTPTLAKDPRFARAASTVSKGIGFSYINMKQMIDWYGWLRGNIDKIVDAKMAELGPDIGEEWRDDIKASVEASLPPMIRDLDSLDVFNKHIGDTVTEFRSTSEGFVGKSYTLRAQ